MKLTRIPLIVTALIALSACGSKTEQSAASQPSSAASPAAEVPATQPASGQPSAAQPTTEPSATSQPAAASQPKEAAPAPKEAAPAPPPPPPPPKKYVVASGTPVSVRTTGDVSSKTAQSGTDFEATLMSALTVDGHTIAKRGATVVGQVVNSDQGGRVKGKASLTLALKSLHLANGTTIPIATNSVTQVAKSGTGKNLKRTGIATGAGAAIGAIAGGGKGAGIGAGIGAGAGVATNLATRGPAADIPPETVLNFELTKDIVVVEKK